MRPTSCLVLPERASGQTLVRECDCSAAAGARGLNAATAVDSSIPYPHIGYLLTTATAGAWPGSVEALGETLSHRLPVDRWRGSHMACVPAEHRGEVWLKRVCPARSSAALLVDSDVDAARSAWWLVS